nr:hypothetical protein [Haliscomenobacter sp.]
MDLHLQDKAIIVTGGGRGIGAGIMHALAREGAIPIIISRSAEHNLKPSKLSTARGIKLPLT